MSQSHRPGDWSVTRLLEVAGCKYGAAPKPSLCLLWLIVDCLGHLVEGTNLPANTHHHLLPQQ